MSAGAASTRLHPAAGLPFSISNLLRMHPPTKCDRGRTDYFWACPNLFQLDSLMPQKRDRNRRDRPSACPNLFQLDPLKPRKYDRGRLDTSIHSGHENAIGPRIAGEHVHSAHVNAAEIEQVYGF